MSEWAVLCGGPDTVLVRRLVESLDDAPSVSWATSQDDLRGMVRDSAEGELGVVVGPTGDGVSEINLAAAIVRDGRARDVSIARRGAAGSFRSRAARAGVDHVFDLAEFETSAAREASSGGFGGNGVPTGLWATEQTVPSDLPNLDVLLGGLEEPPCVADEGASRAPVLVLGSGRGGVGKTTIATCAAVIAAIWGLRPCLLDLDLSCGNAYAHLGLSQVPDLGFLDGEAGVPASLGRVCAVSSQGVSVVGPCSLPETSELVFPFVGGLIEAAAREFDLVVVDTSTTFSDAVAQACQCADRLVLVADAHEGTVVSVARASGLAVRLGVARTRIARLENRASPRTRLDLSAGRAEVGLETARVFRVYDGGRDVRELMQAGRVGELCEEGGLFTESMASFLAQLLAELGCLPDCEEARRAYGWVDGRRRPSLFGLRREAR